MQTTALAEAEPGVESLRAGIRSAHENNELLVTCIAGKSECRPGERAPYSGAARLAHNECPELPDMRCAGHETRPSIERLESNDAAAVLCHEQRFARR